MLALSAFCTAFSTVAVDYSRRDENHCRRLPVSAQRVLSITVKVTSVPFWKVGVLLRLAVIRRAECPEGVERDGSSRVMGAAAIGATPPPGFVEAKDRSPEGFRMPARARVRQNRGSPGVDGMTIGDARDYLREHWPSLRSQLLEGTYQPRPVKRVEIPKPEGGVRKLGVP
jgi:hypothetical protein